jgi:fumarate reductase flavoprotein subunit
MGKSATDIAFDEVYDIVVIGGGGSGLMATVQAARNGNSVAVLEKMPATGGSSAFAEGNAAFESSEQKKRGIDVPKHEAFRRYIEYSHFRANPDVVGAFVENAATTIDKLKYEGVKYLAVKVTAVDQSDQLLTWHIPEGEIAKVCQLLEASARERGADVFLETSATKILMTDGRVAGIEAQDSDGRLVWLGCHAVIIASGGFGANPEMRAKYSRFDPDVAARIINIGATGNTGDGINMALEVGAESFGLGLLMLVPAVRGKTITSHVFAAGLQPYLWVNRTGKRFIDEVVGLNFADAGNVLAEQPEGVAYTVLDQSTVDRLVNRGCDVGLGEYVLTGTKLTQLPEEIEQDVKEGKIAFTAGTIERLGTAMGVDPAVFAATVATYNEACHAGKDTVLHKAKYLLALERAPFYAIRMEPGVLVSIGGIKVNGNLQVIGQTGEPIPGLYAVGVDAGGMYGDAYTLQIPGTSCGFSLTGGWLAANHAGAMIKETKLALQTA